MIPPASLARLAQLLPPRLATKPLAEMDAGEIQAVWTAFASAFPETMPATGWEKPYLREDGTLIIPFGCHPDNQWWKGGRGLAEILRELDAPYDVARRYVYPSTGIPVTAEQWAAYVAGGTLQ